MKNKINWLWLLTATIFISCKKDISKTPPPPEKKYQVITTGYLIDLSPIDYIPCYWVGEKIHMLEKDDALQANGYGLEKIGNDIYIAGNYSPDGHAIRPCYWKNGEMIKLPTRDLVIEDRCSVRDVRYFNDALYFLGDVDLAPYIWIIKNDEISIIKVKGSNNSDNGLISGTNLEIYNNAIYFAGNEAFKKEDGSIVYQSGYFTFDVDDGQAFHVLEDNMGYALCGGLSVSSKGIFINGQAASSPARTDEIPVMWTSNGRMPQITQLNRNRQRVGEVVTDASGNVFTVITDIQTYQPVLWKLPTTGGFEAIKPTVPAGAKGFCNNLAMLDNKLAYAYSYFHNDLYYAFVNMDNKSIELEFDNEHDVRLTRTRIFAE